jgi:hypothetical protein
MKKVECGRKFFAVFPMTRLH